MDGFEIRMNLVGHLRKLNASLSSVKRVVGCLNIHAQTSAGDLWKCLMGEFRKVRVARCCVNILIKVHRVA